MCERRAGGYSLETKFTFLVSQFDKGTVPLPHWLTAFYFSGFAFADSNGGESGVTASTKTQLTCGRPLYIVPRAVSQRSENV